MDIDLGLIYCTCPRELAIEMARALVQRRLAISVDVLPVACGFAYWDSDSHAGADVTLLITAADDLTDEIYDAILERHPGERPPVVTTAVGRSYAGYID